MREFCVRYGFDPGNISKLERGKLAPPQSRDVLQRYALALGLEEGSDEWFESFDTAAATRGEIPADIMADEEVVAKLPVLFRTLRSERVQEEDLALLIEMIKKA